MAGGFTILAVCAGNVHRSPLAASLLRTWAHRYLPAPLTGEVQVGSAGLAAAVGAPMGGRARRLAALLGADDAAHTAVQLRDDAIAGADLVLTATRAQRDEVISRVPGVLRRAFTIREAGRAATTLDLATPVTVGDLTAVVAQFARHRVAAGHRGDDDIIDPQGRDDAAYLQLAREEVEPLTRVARALFGMPGGDADAAASMVADPVALARRLTGPATP